MAPIWHHRPKAGIDSSDCRSSRQGARFTVRGMKPSMAKLELGGRKWQVPRAQWPSTFAGCNLVYQLAVESPQLEEVRFRYPLHNI